MSKLHPTRFPDFMMKKNTMADRHIDTVREHWHDKTCITYTNNPEFEEIIIPEMYHKLAEQYYEDYAGQIQHILAKYGIKDE